MVVSLINNQRHQLLIVVLNSRAQASVSGREASMAE